MRSPADKKRKLDDNQVFEDEYMQALFEEIRRMREMNAEKSDKGTNKKDGNFDEVIVISSDSDEAVPNKPRPRLIHKKPTAAADLIQFDNFPPEIDINKDLKHLAPRSVVDADNGWPDILKNPDTQRNSTFQGTGPTDKDNVFDKHYKFNKDKQFVWTNRNVFNAGKTVLDTDIIDSDNEIVNDDFIRKRSKKCNLQDPDKSFYLKEVGNMGLGLFAKHSIKEGKYVGEYTGELIDDMECAKRCLKYNVAGLSNYVYSTGTSMSIDAGPMGNHIRFINHSCNSNCEAESLSMEDGMPKVMIKATKNIETDEQLFLNYGKGYFKRITCGCNEIDCLEKEKKPRRRETFGGHETEEEVPEIWDSF